MNDRQEFTVPLFCRSSCLVALLRFIDFELLAFVIRDVQVGVGDDQLMTKEPSEG